MKKTTQLRTIGLAVALGLGSLAMVGCTTTTQQSQAAPASSRAAMETAVNETLSRLYSTVPGSREMVAKAAGVLVFPAVVGGSFVVGAEHGKGALRVGGQTAGYYSTTGASIGFQAGGQSRSVIYVFNTRDALQKFRDSKGWTADADATVAVGTVGANGHVDTKTVQQPIASFVLTNVGLEAGVSVGGSKITPITLP